MDEPLVENEAQEAAGEGQRCLHCGRAVDNGAKTCPLCQSQTLGEFKINHDLVEDRVEIHLFALSSEYDIKELRLADDNDQLAARSRIRDMVREDDSGLNLFERGVVLQHLLNIVFNSRCEE